MLNFPFLDDDGRLALNHKSNEPMMLIPRSRVAVTLSLLVLIMRGTPYLDWCLFDRKSEGSSIGAPLEYQNYGTVVYWTTVNDYFLQVA